MMRRATPMIIAALLAASSSAMAASSAGTVASEQKISDTAGSFGGVLDNSDIFGHVGIASLGDLDGDGITDLAVGAVRDDDGGTDRGAVWILFLDSDGTVKAEQKISDTAGGFGGVLDNSDFFGSGLASLGDLDGDGITDLAVGAGSDDDGGTNRGAVWILFLDSDGTVKAEQKISDTAGGFGGVLDNIDSFGQIASANLGDLDGDGITDLAVSAVGDDDGGTDRGAVWILFLDTDGTVKAEQKISDTVGGFGGVLDNVDFFGSALASLGDLDGDGITDLAVGARNDDDGGTNRGAVWTLFLDTDVTVNAEQKISDTAGGFGGVLDNSDSFGISLARLDDLDGKGVTDLAVGASLDDDGGTDRGAVWILFMNRIVPPAVAAALADAGIAPSDVPPEVLDALTAADELGLLDVIAPNTTANQNLIVPPDGAVVLGEGSVVNGGIEGGESNTVVFGGNSIVNGSIVGVGVSFIGGSNVEINGNLEDSMRELVVGPGAQVHFTGSVAVATLIIEDGGSLVVDGNFDVSESVTLGPNAFLQVDNFTCPGATASIDLTATVIILGNNDCGAL